MDVAVSDGLVHVKPGVIHIGFLGFVDNLHQLHRRLFLHALAPALQRPAAEEDQEGYHVVVIAHLGFQQHVGQRRAQEKQNAHHHKGVRRPGFAKGIQNGYGHQQEQHHVHGAAYGAHAFQEGLQLLC